MEEEEQEARIAVRVQANAHQNKVLGFKDGVLHLKIAAPPVKGKANQELIRFLSDILTVSKGHLSIEKGLTSKKKIIAIKGQPQNRVESQLDQHQKTEGD